MWLMKTLLTSRCINQREQVSSAPRDLLYTHHGALVFIFLMICTKSVVRNNLNSLNKTHKNSGYALSHYTK